MTANCAGRATADNDPFFDPTRGDDVNRAAEKQRKSWETREESTWLEEM